MIIPIFQEKSPLFHLTYFAKNAAAAENQYDQPQTPKMVKYAELYTPQKLQSYHTRRFYIYMIGKFLILVNRFVV